MRRALVKSLLVALALAGCSVLGPDAAALRVYNAGTEALGDLTLFSPGSEVSFGSIAPGAWSEYRVMPGGVYPYSAFEFTYNGTRVSQPVTDFVGESPMKGSRFTYTLSLTTSGTTAWINITSVVRDK